MAWCSRHRSSLPVAELTETAEIYWSCASMVLVSLYHHDAVYGYTAARAVGRLTSMLSPNGLFEGAPKVAESPTVKFDRLAVRLYNWTLNAK